MLGQVVCGAFVLRLVMLRLVMLGNIVCGSFVLK